MGKVCLLNDKLGYRLNNYMRVKRSNFVNTRLCIAFQYEISRYDNLQITAN